MFDLIFTDLCMPAMTGDRFAAAIKVVAPDQTIVMVTAHLEKMLRTPMAGIDVFLGKPFELGDLRDVISRYSRPWCL